MRILIAGAGAIGASIALHLAQRGARGIVVADRALAMEGASAKATGGIRLQFTTPAEIALVRRSVAWFEELGPPRFVQAGYLFLATTEKGRAELRARFETQARLGVPVEWVDAGGAARLAAGLRTDGVLGGIFGRKDGLADPPAIGREMLRRAVSLGVELRERADARTLEADVRVIAAGARSREVGEAFGVDLPIRPLRRQLLETTEVAGLDAMLPMVVEHDTGFHFRRRDRCLRLGMPDPDAVWGFDEEPDRSLEADRMERLARRFPIAAGARVERSWAGLYDMTPDAHPILGRVADGVFAACGFSGHGFMQSPAVGEAIAEEILEGATSFDLAPFRLARFAGGAADFSSVHPL